MLVHPRSPASTSGLHCDLRYPPFCRILGKASSASEGCPSGCGDAGRVGPDCADCSRLLWLWVIEPQLSLASAKKFIGSCTSKAIGWPGLRRLWIQGAKDGSEWVCFPPLSQLCVPCTGSTLKQAALPRLILSRMVLSRKRACGSPRQGSGRLDHMPGRWLPTGKSGYL